MKASTLLLLFAAIRVASPLTCWAAPKQIIHFQQGSPISSIVANHAYIDTLPFDGIVVEYPDDFRAIGPSYVADYTNLYNQLSPVKGVLQKVTHNYALVLSGVHGLPDPFDAGLCEQLHQGGRDRELPQRQPDSFSRGAD